MERAVEEKQTSFYEILGLSKNATSEAIKKAYKVLSLQDHPDKNPNGKNMFAQILEAYEVLVDPDKRKLYDTGSQGLLIPCFKGSAASDSIMEYRFQSIQDYTKGMHPDTIMQKALENETIAILIVKNPDVCSAINYKISKLAIKYPITVAPIMIDTDTILNKFCWANDITTKISLINDNLCLMLLNRARVRRDLTQKNLAEIKNQYQSNKQIQDKIHTILDTILESRASKNQQNKNVKFDMEEFKQKDNTGKKLYLKSFNSSSLADVFQHHDEVTEFALDNNDLFYLVEQHIAYLSNFYHSFNIAQKVIDSENSMNLIMNNTGNHVLYRIAKNHSTLCKKLLSKELMQKYFFINELYTMWKEHEEIWSEVIKKNKSLSYTIDLFNYLKTCLNEPSLIDIKQFKTIITKYNRSIVERGIDGAVTNQLHNDIISIVNLNHKLAPLLCNNIEFTSELSAGNTITLALINKRFAAQCTLVMIFGSLRNENNFIMKYFKKDLIKLANAHDDETCAQFLSDEIMAFFEDKELFQLSKKFSSLTRQRIFKNPDVKKRLIEYSERNLQTKNQGIRIVNAYQHTNTTRENDDYRTGLYFYSQCSAMSQKQNDSDIDTAINYFIKAAVDGYQPALSMLKEITFTTDQQKLKVADLLMSEHKCYYLDKAEEILSSVDDKKTIDYLIAQASQGRYCKPFADKLWQLRLKFSVEQYSSVAEIFLKVGKNNNYYNLICGCDFLLKSADGINKTIRYLLDAIQNDNPDAADKLWDLTLLESLTSNQMEIIVDCFLNANSQAYNLDKGIKALSRSENGTYKATEYLIPLMQNNVVSAKKLLIQIGWFTSNKDQKHIKAIAEIYLNKSLDFYDLKTGIELLLQTNQGIKKAIDYLIKYTSNYNDNAAADMLYELSCNHDLETTEHKLIAEFFLDKQHQCYSLDRGISCLIQSKDNGLESAIDYLLALIESGDRNAYNKLAAITGSFSKIPSDKQRTSIASLLLNSYGVIFDPHQGLKLLRRGFDSKDLTYNFIATIQIAYKWGDINLLLKSVQKLITQDSISNLLCNNIKKNISKYISGLQKSCTSLADINNFCNSAIKNLLIEYNCIPSPKFQDVIYKQTHNDRLTTLIAGKTPGKNIPETTESWLNYWFMILNEVNTGKLKLNQNIWNELETTKPTALKNISNTPAYKDLFSRLSPKDLMFTLYMCDKHKITVDPGLISALVGSKIPGTKTIAEQMFTICEEMYNNDQQDLAFDIMRFINSNERMCNEHIKEKRTALTLFFRTRPKGDDGSFDYSRRDGSQMQSAANLYEDWCRVIDKACLDYIANMFAHGSIISVDREIPTIENRPGDLILLYTDKVYENSIEDLMLRLYTCDKLNININPTVIKNLVDTKFDDGKTLAEKMLECCQQMIKNNNNKKLAIKLLASINNSERRSGKHNKNNRTHLTTIFRTVPNGIYGEYSRNDGSQMQKACLAYEEYCRQKESEYLDIILNYIVKNNLTPDLKTLKKPMLTCGFAEIRDYDTDIKMLLGAEVNEKWSVQNLMLRLYICDKFEIEVTDDAIKYLVKLMPNGEILTDAILNCCKTMAKNDDQKDLAFDILKHINSREYRSQNHKKTERTILTNIFRKIPGSLWEYSRQDNSPIDQACDLYEKLAVEKGLLRPVRNSNNQGLFASFWNAVNEPQVRTANVNADTDTDEESLSL